MTISQHHFCVPTALSILTNLNVNFVELLLRKEYLGDQPIGGIYIGLALKFLRDNGYHFMAYQKEGQTLCDLDRNSTSADSWLVEIKGHALVMRDSVIYDNTFPRGIGIDLYPNSKIIRAYSVGKKA